MKITDRELLTALAPLGDKLTKFSHKPGGSLSSGEKQILIDNYAHLQERAQGQLTRNPCWSCVGQIITVFTVYSSWYVRTKDAQDQEDQAEIDNINSHLISTNAKLDNEKFVKNAKPDIIANEQNKKTVAEAKIAAIKNKKK